MLQLHGQLSKRFNAFVVLFLSSLLGKGDLKSLAAPILSWVNGDKIHT